MQNEDSPNPKNVGLWELVRYFLHLGSFGFGGPIALAGYMQRDLVPRGWITTEEYNQGLAFAQMMPGPLAAQLAMWIGFIRHGVVGASLVGIVFILPPYLIVVIIAALYVKYNGLAVVQALFYGIGPAVIAIIALSAIRLARTNAMHCFGSYSPSSPRLHSFREPKLHYSSLPPELSAYSCTLHFGRRVSSHERTR